MKMLDVVNFLKESYPKCCHEFHEVKILFTKKSFISDLDSICWYTVVHF